MTAAAAADLKGSDLSRHADIGAAQRTAEEMIELPVTQTNIEFLNRTAKFLIDFIIRRIFPTAANRIFGKKTEKEQKRQQKLRDQQNQTMEKSVQNRKDQPNKEQKFSQRIHTVPMLHKGGKTIPQRKQKRHLSSPSATGNDGKQTQKLRKRDCKGSDIGHGGGAQCFTGALQFFFG